MVIGLHRRRSFVPGSILWTPANLAVAPRCWVNGDSSSNFIFSSGIKVSQWNDLSGNNNHLATSNTSQQPDYLSSQPGVQFVNSSTERLTYANFNQTIFDMYMVARIDSYLSGRLICNFNSSSATYALTTNNDSPGGHVQENNTRNAQSGAYSQIDGGVAEIPGYIGYRLNDTTNYHLYTSYCTTGIASARPVIGVSHTNTLHPSITVKECIWLGYNASTSDREKIEGYLGWRHSILLASGHPYFSAPPYL